jgi:uroporphyrinogen decarboxylase
MTPRERVKQALDHKEPDRIPFDLGGTIITSITKGAYLNLRRYLGFPEEDVRTFDHVQQLPYLDEELLKRLNADVRMVQTHYVRGDDLVYSEEENYYYFYDRWGSKLRMPKEDGYYFDWVEFPIREISMDALKQYTWPELDSYESLRKLKERARDLYENTEYALAGTGVFGGGIFEQPARIMGMELFLMSLASDEKFADTMMEKITEIYIENCNRYLDELGEYIQVFVYWNDITSQNRPLISPKMFRRLIKPKDRRLIEAVKKKTDAKIFYHCCGAAREFIPDLIEIGVDILNPVQVSAKGMDTAELKREFGNDITFWGGGCDTQHVLPNGTPQEVRKEVKKRIDDLAPGGGFVFNTVHNIQPDVPPENIMAMWEILQEYGIYEA